MAAGKFTPGSPVLQPGVWFRTISLGETKPETSAGTVAVLIEADSGPLNEVVDCQSFADLDVFATGGGVDVAREAMRGGADVVKVIRVGDSDGSVASRSLLDGNDDAIAEVSFNYIGIRGSDFSVTVRDYAADSDYKEFLVYDGTTLVERFLIPDEANGGDETDSLIAAVNGVSKYVTISVGADNPGTGSLAAITEGALSTNGDNPSVTSSEYIAGFGILTGEDFGVVTLDSEDSSIHSSFATQVQEWRDGGKLVIGVVGEPTSATFPAGIPDFSNAAAINSEGVVYVANGGKDSTGVIREGAEAAGRVAGMIAQLPVTNSLTHRLATGWTSVVSEPNYFQIDKAIQNGALVFKRSTSGVPMVAYGNNTLVTLDSNQDAGWKKIRRVRTRDELINRIALATEPMVGQITNNLDGQSTVISVISGVVSDMISLGALLSGTVSLDPANPPTGDSVYLLIEAQDADSIEKFYITFGFSF